VERDERLTVLSDSCAVLGYVADVSGSVVASAVIPAAIVAICARVSVYGDMSLVSHHEDYKSDVVSWRLGASNHERYRLAEPHFVGWIALAGAHYPYHIYQVAIKLAESNY